MKRRVCRAKHGRKERRVKDRSAAENRDVHLPLVAQPSPVVCIHCPQRGKKSQRGKKNCLACRTRRADLSFLFIIIGANRIRQSGAPRVCAAHRTKEYRNYMTKSSKILLWAMLGVVLVLILSIVLSGLLMNGRTEEVDNTEFFQIIGTGKNAKGEDVSVDEIRIDLYNVSAIDRDGKEENSRVLVIYKTTIGRFSAEYERIIDAAEKNGIKVNQSDPNEGSWISYLIPLFGIVLVCVVF